MNAVKRKIMLQEFSFSRWWMLVSSHWGENRKRYLLSMLAIGGMIAGWYGFLIAMDRFGPLNFFVQYMTYYAGLFVIGCLYASTVFSALGSKAEGIGYLSVPASHFEKLLCGIFFGVVLFFVVYTLIFYVVDIPMVRLANRVIREQRQVWPGSGLPIGEQPVLTLLHNEWAPLPDKKYHLFLLAYFALQSAFLAGSVYFSRYSFIKTIVALLLGWLVLMLFMVKGVENHLPGGWRTYDFFSWSNYNNDTGGFKMISPAPWLEHLLLFLLMYSGPVVFWFVAYYRLKEKEV